MVPMPTTLYQDPSTGRYYNSQGKWVDRLGRNNPHRGPPGQFRSRGKNWPNRNPGGPGANPPHVHSRFGERSHLGPARQWVPPDEAAQGPPAAAQGPPAAAHRRSADTVMEEQDPSPRGEHRARSRQPLYVQCPRGDAQGRTRPASHRRSAWERGEQRARPRRPDSRGSPAAAQGSRATSTGPSQQAPRGRANRSDWHKCASRSRDGDWNRDRW